MTTDRIERELTIAAPIERVWNVLTQPEHVGVWFGVGKPIEIDLRPGGVMMLDHGDHGVFPTLIVKVDAPNYFAYRWASAYPGEQATEENSTLVEFTLSQEGEQTLLQLVESGFATHSIPDGHDREASYASHSTGWTEVLGKLASRVEGS